MTPNPSPVRTRRRFQAASLVAGALLIAACGGSDKSVLDNNKPSTTAASSTSAPTGSSSAPSDSTATSDSASSTSQAVSTSAATPLDSLPDCPVDALASATSPVEITVWHSLNADLLSSTLAKLTDEYNASQNKVKVKYVNQGAYEESIKKYFETSQGQRPDVVQFP